MKLDDAELLESSERKAGGGVRDGRIQSSREPQGPLSLEGRLVRYLLSSLGDPPLRFTLWNGESATGGEGRALGSLRIADRASLLKLLINPNLYFGDTYSDGSIEIEGDLAAVIESLELNCADYAQDRVMQPIHGFRTGIIGETPVETRYPEAASYGILRREFDDYLLRRSQARLRLGEFKGHAYLLYPASRRKLTDDGALVIGDAAGLAYPQSGEGILPAIESGLIAAQVIREAAGDYRQHKLEPYIGRLTARFGKRNPRPPSASWLPQAFRQKLAKRLMATRWFARHVVINNWFLHSGQRTALTRRSL